MAEKIVLNVNNSSQISEELDDTQHPGGKTAAQRTLQHNDFGVDDSFDENTTVKPRFVLSLDKTITIAAPFDIDLTAAPLSVGRTVDLTGKRLIYYEFETPSTNTGTATINCSQANPFELFGAINVDMILNKHDRVSRILQGNDGPVVAAGKKAIRLTVTQDNDKVRLKMVFGD